jgi:hypothetical protein
MVLGENPRLTNGVPAARLAAARGASGEVLE